MNKDLFEGKWHEFRGKIKEKWGRFTDNDLTQINGKREIFLGKLQSYYGLAKDRAEKELADFERTLTKTKESKSEKEKPEFASKQQHHHR